MSTSPNFSGAKRQRRTDKPRKPTNIKRYVMWLLGKREWGATELAERLRQRDCTEQEIAETLAWAQEMGFQSDTRFVGMKVRQYAPRKGNRFLRMMLTQKGVEESQVEDAVSQLPDEKDRAIHAASRFAGKEMDQKTQQKVWRFLASRGFGTESIRHAMKRLKSPEPEFETA